LFSPFELKARLLIEGISLGRIDAGPWKERTEHLYQHDGGNGAVVNYPQELVLSQGPSPEWDTVVNIRHNPASLWRVSSTEQGRFVLAHADGSSLEVSAVDRPEFYKRTLSTGAATSSVVQHLGRDALGVIPNNHCSYFATGDQCRFCEIEGTYKERVAYPKLRKSVDVIVEGISLAAALSDASHVILTAGNLRKNDSTASIYCDILEGLNDDCRPGLYRYGSIMAPETFAWIHRLAACGLNGVGFNLEFHNPDQFARLAPGKNAYGREKLLAALEESVSSFGAGNVFSNLVFGIQTWTPQCPVIDFSREVDCCLRAIDDLLERGIIPLFTLYHSSGKNQIGPVALDLEAVLGFHREYARRTHASKLVPDSRSGVLFNVGTIANHICSDALAELRPAPTALAS